MTQKNDNKQTTLESVGVEIEHGYIQYKVPFVRGFHKSVFEELAQDPEVRPAEEIELVYIFREAFNSEKEGWKKIRDEVVSRGLLRSPKRLQYVFPKKSTKPWEPFFEGGVFVERDIEGLGTSTEIPYENAEGDWVLEDGVYVNKQAEITFVPNSNFKRGIHTASSFVEDGLVRTLLGGRESAEIYAKIAADNEKELLLAGLDKEDQDPHLMRVASLSLARPNRLILSAGGMGWSLYPSFAAGVLN